MEAEVVEIVKEFRARVEGLDFPIKGRILKSSDGGDGFLYYSEFSHHCKPFEDAATDYSPGMTRKEYSSAELILKDYLKNFTTFGVVINKFYK